MKNLLRAVLLVFLCTLVTHNVNSQGLFFHFNAGYNHSMSAQNIYNEDLGLSFVNVSAGQNSATFEKVFVSLGKGANFGGAIGYMFSEYVGLELGLSYLLGLKTKANWTYPDGNAEYALSSSMFRIIPAIIITPGLDKVNPYAKFGLVLGIGSTILDMEESDDGDKMVAKVKFNGGMAVGLNAAVGIHFTFSDRIGMFTEINMVNMSYAPTKGEVTELTYNGMDELPDLTTREREVEFVNEIVYSNTDPPDSQPDQLLKYKLPFGSVGIHIGLVITISK